jgi:hypothetical protein
LKKTQGQDAWKRRAQEIANPPNGTTPPPPVFQEDSSEDSRCKPVICNRLHDTTEAALTTKIAAILVQTPHYLACWPHLKLRVLPGIGGAMGRLAVDFASIWHRLAARAPVRGACIGALQTAADQLSAAPAGLSSSTVDP